MPIRIISTRNIVYFAMDFAMDYVLLLDIRVGYYTYHILVYKMLNHYYV